MFSSPVFPELFRFCIWSALPCLVWSYLPILNGSLLYSCTCSLFCTHVWSFLIFSTFSISIRSVMLCLISPELSLFICLVWSLPALFHSLESNACQIFPVLSDLFSPFFVWYFSCISLFILSCPLCDKFCLNLYDLSCPFLSDLSCLEWSSLQWFIYCIPCCLLSSDLCSPVFSRNLISAICSCLICPAQPCLIFHVLLCLISSVMLCPQFPKCSLLHLRVFYFRHLKSSLNTGFWVCIRWTRARSESTNIHADGRAESSGRDWLTLKMSRV